MIKSVKGCKAATQHPQLAPRAGGCCLGHEQQMYKCGNYGLDRDGHPKPRAFREWLCDTLSGGKHWFWGDDGGHTGIGLNGPEVSRWCKLCGNHIKWA